MIDALVISILTAAPVLALRFGWVEQSAAPVVIAGVAFCYFSLLKRHRFFDRSKPAQRQRRSGAAGCYACRNSLRSPAT
jgi:hypothetical protein